MPQIDYTELLELMYLKHHTRKSLAKESGYTEQAIGGWLKQGKPMPGRAIIHITKRLRIPDEQIGIFFFTQRR